MHRIIFQAGPFTLYSYGLFVAAGFLLATILILRDSREAGLPRDAVMDCLISVLIGGLVGGRLLFVAINWQQYSQEPLRIIMLQEGGLAIQGALAGGIISGLLATRYKGIPFWKAADLAAPYLALAQALGRIGCFLNGCCFGMPVGSGIGVTYPGEQVVRFPTQIYSSILLMGIFIILLRAGRKKHFEGRILSLYLILYSALRLLMDNFRGDGLTMVFGTHLSQLISAGTLILGLAFYLMLRERGAYGKT